ncbi:MAG: MG2 domain-containing protein [Janthinobacterium lividum]
MRIILLCCVLLMTVFLADSAAPGPPGTFASQWKKIDALLKKEQTASAAPLVESIYQQAKKANNAPAYVRALLYKIRLLAAKENDADEKAIALLEADLATAQFPARPILHSLLASLYADYYNQHRYQLYQRTPGAAPTADQATPGSADGGTTLATWDAGRLGAAIVRHYELSVADEPQRQLRTTLADLGDLATSGDAAGRALRPTLYDLLAQRAIAGLQNQELYITRPAQQFQATDPQLFGSAQEFAALPLPVSAADSLNGQLHALRLLQRLTAARVAAGNLAALADVDLQRLDYLHGLNQDSDLNDRYVHALTRSAETYKGLPISTEFIARFAENCWATGKAKDDSNGAKLAVFLAEKAEARFPKSRGAARARQLREQIEQPELSFSAADMVVPGQPWRLDLTARNVTALHAWAYRVSSQEWEGFNQYDGRNEPVAARYARALKAGPAATWLVPVPTQPLDYKQQKLVGVGAVLPVGYYLVVISNQASQPLATKAGAATAYALVGASELSVAHRRQPSTGATQLLVLQRQSGAPLAGLSVQATYRYYDRASRQQVSRLGEVRPTTALGTAELAAPARNDKSRPDEQLAAARVWRGADTLAVRNLNGYYYGQQAAGDEPETKCFLFTDRAIYRPGQTVYFKGILVERQGNKSRVLAKKEQEVALEDANGDTVQKLSFVTNDFGSFNGSFVLPTGRLNGEFALRADSTADEGEVKFSVEDYKRPTFYVQLDSVPGRPQLGQPLAVSGRARAYAGQPTDGATVSYRVTRRELWPLFGYGYGGRGGRGGSQEIAHGTATTDAEGRFSLTFTPPLVPNGPGQPRYQPGYVFEVTADVTDAAGETRTGSRCFAIGRNPLSLQLTGPALVDKQRLPPFRLLSTNATGEPLPAAGTLRLLARRYRPNPPGVPGPTPETADNEAPAELVKTLAFDTRTSPVLDLTAALAGLPTGRYRLEAQAAGADTAKAQRDFTLYDAEAATIPFATPDWFVSLRDSVAPGQPATILLGSSEADARVLLEVERGGQLLRQEWLTLRAGEQRRLAIESGPTTASGPLYIHTVQVRDNHLYSHQATVQVAAPEPPLQLAISTFRNRLQPGQQETWRISIRQANGRPAEAELLATLYDQSLDLFKEHRWPPLAMNERYQEAQFGWQGNFGSLFSQLLPRPEKVTGEPALTYPVLNTQYAGGSLLAEYLRALNLTESEGLYASRALQGRVAGVQIQAAVPVGPVIRIRGVSSIGADSKALNEVMVVGYGTQQRADLTGAVSSITTSPRAVDLTGVKARSDFRETAFWQPALHTDKNGNIVLEFQMPEAVTRWQLLALAHDKNLRTGQLARQLVTQKEIQIASNAPRFLRQGDTFTLPAKFSNLTDHATRGTAQLTLLDAATGQDITSQLLQSPAQLAVSATAHQSMALGWQLSLPPDFASVAVTYRVVAQTTAAGETKSNKRKATPATFSDGEENTLPVLPNRILLTESLPLPLVGAGTRTFELPKLTSTNSSTRRNYSLTLEMTSNPAWYAVQSLPYLMEYPYECSEQTFSRLYANLLAAQILKANPRFKTVLAEWTRQAQSGTAPQRDQLSSKLAQNQELKNLLLEETPWVRDARGETERLARLSTLFDEARLRSETTRILAKLQAMQLPDGGFPWFERMPTDRYLTQLIVAGFGKLKKLGAFDASQDDAARPLLQNALRYLDAAAAADYAQLRQQKAKLADNHLADVQIQALYARSYWPQVAEPAAAQPAYVYYRGQAAQYWPGQTRYLQAQAALALFRENAQALAAQAILRALAENALHSPELGMYWQDVRPGYYWHEAPTETQATLIEAFDEVKHDQKSVEEMKLWLLAHKQTNSWESTRATTDACYALLLRGADWLAPTQPLQATVGGEKLQFSATQAGTGYVKTSWPAAEIKPAQGKITLTKPDAGVAWGALYWQYFEDMDQVTPAATPLSLERQLYRETRTAAGPTLEKITSATPLRVGDALVVRLVLRTDRALEYVHLKDQRAAGLEPTQQTSGYRYQGGLSYYESPRDAATNFFISTVPRGTYVFEYRLRASQAGDFSGGLSEVQCLYAPGFGAHSAGQRLRIAGPAK